MLLALLFYSAALSPTCYNFYLNTFTDSCNQNKFSLRGSDQVPSPRLIPNILFLIHSSPTPLPSKTPANPRLLAAAVTNGPASRLSCPRFLATPATFSLKWFKAAVRTVPPPLIPPRQRALSKRGETPNCRHKHPLAALPYLTVFENLPPLYPQHCESENLTCANTLCLSGCVCILSL